MQARPVVGQVDGDPAPPRLGVDQAARLDEAGDVGDGIRQHDVVAVGVDRERLVEVGAAGRVEGDELDVGAIDRLHAVDLGVEVAEHGRR